MATYTQTMAQAALLVNDELVRGVAEDFITINPMYSYLPWTGYDGQAIIVNRELTLGKAGVLAFGTTSTDNALVSTHKGAATFTSKTFTATKLIADAEMDGLVQAQSVSDGVDQIAIEISSKAKNIGRLFQTGMATGTGTSPQMNSLDSMNDGTQVTTASTTGGTGDSISFVLLDELCDLVKSKDGQVDWIMLPSRTLRAIKVLYRGLGGAMPYDVLVMPDGTSRSVYKFEDIPVFKNEYLSVEETANGAGLTGGVLTSVWAGVWDDGSRKVGLSAIHPAAVPAGIVVHPVGYKEDYDQEIWRIKQYANMALFNMKGLARLYSINN
jgi:hypothetical protein